MKKKREENIMKTLFYVDSIRFYFIFYYYFFYEFYDISWKKWLRWWRPISFIKIILYFNKKMLKKPKKRELFSSKNIQHSWHATQLRGMKVKINKKKTWNVNKVLFFVRPIGHEILCRRAGRTKTCMGIT